MEALAAIGRAGDGVAEIPDQDPSRAFSRVWREHGRQLYGTALRMLRRPEDAEEVVQDAFLSFHREDPEVPTEHLGRWLNRVVVNGCLDRLRRGKRWREEELGERTQPSSARPDLRLDIARAVDQLPERARLVFLLHDVEGLRHEELSEALGVSVGTTKSQLFRARRMLRDLMRGEK
jgi:RNA polymerase sigma-70 factor, ECF subfamily